MERRLTTFDEVERVYTEEEARTSPPRLPGCPTTGAPTPAPPASW